MRRPAFLLAFALLVFSLPARAADAPVSPDDPAKLVRRVLAAPVEELDPALIPAFMDVDPGKLPEKMRMPYKAKREELLTLKKIAEGKRKPPLRRLSAEGDATCSEPLSDAQAVAFLKTAGYEEIYEEEERRLMQDTRCSECELEEEFSLKRVLVSKREKGGKNVLERHYFLHVKDPLWGMIGAYRAGENSAFGTSFFGTGGRPACH